MAEPTETTIPTGEKHSISWGGFIFWPFLVLLLYLLSTGPVIMMMDKGFITGDSKLLRCYEPLDSAYRETLLHQPLGMYLHLWSKRFDKNGDEKLIR
jgi:hypothetical protein